MKTLQRCFFSCYLNFRIFFLSQLYNIHWTPLYQESPQAPHGRPPSQKAKPPCQCVPCLILFDSALCWAGMLMSPQEKSLGKLGRGRAVKNNPKHNYFYFHILPAASDQRTHVRGQCLVAATLGSHWGPLAQGSQLTCLSVRVSCKPVMQYGAIRQGQNQVLT